LTKLDVLSSFDEVKVGVSYKKGDHTLNAFPGTLEDLEDYKIEWATFPGWKTVRNCVFMNA